MLGWCPFRARWRGATTPGAALRLPGLWCIRPFGPVERSAHETRARCPCHTLVAWASAHGANTGRMPVPPRGMGVPPIRQAWQDARATITRRFAEPRKRKTRCAHSTRDGTCATMEKLCLRWCLLRCLAVRVRSPTGLSIFYLTLCSFSPIQLFCGR